MVIKANKSSRETMITRHRNYKSLFLFTICILVVTSMVLSPLLVSCVPSVTEEEGALPEEEAAPELQAEGKIIIVTSTADSGPSTLRQALQDVQSGDTIAFAPTVFPPGAPATIYVSSELPAISQGNLSIDASDAGVILDGSHIGEEFVPGLEIVSNGNAVQGLQIVNFIHGAGIVLSGGAQNNTVGGDRSTGSGPVGQGNLVSNGDVGIGLWDNGTSFNTITGNLIGTDPTGAEDWGNSGSGIWIEDGAKHNTIGPDNIIAYNMHGIEIRDSNSLGNTVTQNSIYDNEGEGIHLWEGGNAEVPAPFIFDFDLAAGTVMGTACANCTIEIFSDNSNQGEVYEGETIADDAGAFSFNKGAPFNGPHLMATAINADGNTSQFSVPTSGTGRSMILQKGNTLPKHYLRTSESQELDDNYICTEMGGYEDGYAHLEWVYPLGFKWVRASTGRSPLNWQYVESETGDCFIDPAVDKTVNEYIKYGINIVLNLGIGNAETRPDTTRFKSEEDIERYCNYVRCVVREFKDRIEYYEIWNEPNIPEEHAPHGGIALEDYVRLIKQVATVIRQEYPNAKIVIGAVGGLWLPDYPGYGDTLRHTVDIDYLHRLLKSGVAPIVDVISWHPFYGNLADDPYYQSYPQIVDEIKELATANGFRGEYLVEEMVWRTPDDPLDTDLPRFSERIVGKYYARSIIMHRGLDVIAGIALHAAHDTIHNLCTTMAGAEPIDLPVEIQSEATNILHYGFSLPKGDKLLALWINGVPVDNDPGIVVTLTLSGSSVQKVVGIDVLNGFEQELITNIKDGTLVISNLLVKDYPIILRFTDAGSS